MEQRRFSGSKTGGSRTQSTYKGRGGSSHTSASRGGFGGRTGGRTSGHSDRNTHAGRAGGFGGARASHTQGATQSGFTRRSTRPSAPREGREGGERSSFDGTRTGYAPRAPRSGHSSYTPRTEGAAPRREYGSSGSSRDGGRSFARPRFEGAPGRRHSSGFDSRPSFGGGRSSNRKRDERIDPSKFINKAVITEEIEHFIPEHQFADFKITQELKAAIAAKGYVNPTPIQDRSIPHTLQGVDVVGIANTGTGKTGAFLIPILNKVMVDLKEAALVVVPTRELALQIEEELQGFIRGSRIRSVCCFGGANISRQIEALRSHRHFVIGTPGRLKDLLERRKLDLSQFRTVVLDEADRMLDMGFVHDMRTILAQVPKERQTLFFSATISPEVEKLIHEFLNEPVRISVKTRDTSKNIDQDVIHVPRGGSKFDVLADLLKKPDFARVLVFGRTKHGVDKLARQLSAMGIVSESIHGNKNNAKRQQALRMFKMGRVRVLVATDVAARGLDISDVTHVINFDVPATYDDYVHRIGRTGRGNKKGIALTLIEG